jgi:hypothetical protein
MRTAFQCENQPIACQFTFACVEQRHRRMARTTVMKDGFLPARSGPSQLDRVNRRRFARPKRQGLASELLLCFVNIVRATTQFHIRHRGRTSSRVRHDVMKLEASGLGAAAPFSAKHTSASIAPPHLAPDRRRHVSRLCSRLATGLSLSIRSRNLSFRELSDEQRQRAIEDGRGITVRNVASQ